MPADELEKDWADVLPPGPCNHGITFDLKEAQRVLAEWEPKTGAEFIAGNPASTEIRRRWPRLSGVCPKGCGYNGIYYASSDHYVAGDW